MHSGDEPLPLRVERILKKLDEVRLKRLPSFGSDKHRFRLHEPLGEEVVRAFEAEHEIKLPAAYRAFLTLAGNGGAGPFYGVYRLEQWHELYDFACDQIPKNILALDSPLSPDQIRDEAWESRLPECVSPFQGLLQIGTQGCTYELALIVSGAHAGRVVTVDLDLQPPAFFREPDFLSWYESWLDGLLAAEKSSKSSSS